MTKRQIYGLRIGIGVFVFLFFKFASGNLDDWNNAVFTSAVFTMAVVLILFEILDFSSRHLIRNYRDRLTSYGTLSKFYIGNCLVSAPLVIGASYLHTEVIVPQFECCAHEWEPGLLTTMAQGLALSWLIIMAKTFMIYFEYSRRSESEKALIQKELAQSKYESLKDQIKPHFLFNSFSVLTSIIEEDPKQAVEFVSRLSKIYRYVLDTNSQLVPLKIELEYLEHYTFLLKTRHQFGLEIDVTIDLDTSNHQLPILALQMLVENALKHNNFSKEEPLKIEISNIGSEKLAIKNNLNRKQKARKGKRIGLENIRSRYEMLVNQEIEIIDDDQFFSVIIPLEPINPNS